MHYHSFSYEDLNEENKKINAFSNKLGLDSLNARQIINKNCNL